MPRTIVHLDADAFFASVEQAADTRLRGRPIAGTRLEPSLLCALRQAEAPIRRGAAIHSG